MLILEGHPMKTILIAPSERPAVAFLAGNMPLAAIPLLGRPLLAYWLESLAASGIRETKLLSIDRTEQLNHLLQAGETWGLKIDVVPAMREPTPAEARAQYKPQREPGWAPEPNDAILMDRFPGSELNLFASYTNFFQGLCEWQPRALQTSRVGLREIQPGVWAGLRSHIHPSARFQAPCWIGDNVRIGPEAILGPYAILERAVVLDGACELEHTWVGPETFVGSLTRLANSLAWGNTLINWKTRSCTHVPDPFLLSSLSNQPAGGLRPSGFASRFLPANWPRPADLLMSVKSKFMKT